MSSSSFAENQVLRDFIKSTSTSEKIEFYWSKPEGNGPFPALLMIHPEQDSPKNGGESFVKYGQLDFWIQKGFLTIAISQPGYGASEGSADFCGPKTQNAVFEVIKHFQSMPEVKPDRFFIYGGSRGAVVASMVATKEIQVAGVILKSGVYDFKEWVDLRPWYDPIKLQMLWEIGWLTQEKLELRSASNFADKIKTPLLVIHGTKDDKAPIVLSGYLIGHQLFSAISEKQMSLRKFYLRRILRTWPNYIVVLALYFAVSDFREKSNLPPLWKFLTFTQNFDLNFSAFSHAWSLCIEEQFYLVLPIISLLFVRLNNRRAVIFSVLALILSGVILRGSLWHTFVDGAQLDQIQYFNKIYYPTWGRLDGLIFGVCLAALRNFNKQFWEKLMINTNRLLFLGVGVCVIGFLLLENRFLLLPTMIGFPILALGFSFLVLSAAGEQSYLNRVKIPGVGLVATLSYSLYLLHKQMFHISKLLMTSWGIEEVSVMNLMLPLALSFMAASLLYLTIEKPFLLLRNQLLR